MAASTLIRTIDHAATYLAAKRRQRRVPDSLTFLEGIDWPWPVASRPIPLARRAAAADSDPAVEAGGSDPAGEESDGATNLAVEEKSSARRR
jgi:hypothetical protein